MLLPRAGASSRPTAAEIAAAQWEITNRTALKDLRSLPAERWMTLRYSDLVANPRHAVQQICRFSGIEFDSALERRVAGSLPVSRYTPTPPAPENGGATSSRARRAPGRGGDVAGLEKLDAALASLTERTAEGPALRLVAQRQALNAIVSTQTRPSS